MLDQLTDTTLQHLNQLRLQNAAQSGQLTEHMQNEINNIYAATQIRQGTKLTPYFDTVLDSKQEAAFQNWKQQYAPNDSGADYDLRGAFKAGLTPDPVTGHWADTYKKPNHPTFSDQSKYAPYGNPGRWEGDTFIPPLKKSELPAPFLVADSSGSYPVRPIQPSAGNTTLAYGDTPTGASSGVQGAGTYEPRDLEAVRKKQAAQDAASARATTNANRKLVGLPPLK